jgi:hypothetical protein
MLLGGVAVAMLVACSGGGSQPTGAASGPRLVNGASAHPGSPAPASQAAAISGHLGYPAEVLPAQVVYAISVDGSTYYRVETMWGQSPYSIVGVPAGDYFVYTSARPLRAGSSGAQHFGAAYTKAVPCGLDASCTDHSLITVHVQANQTSADIDPIDWYGSADALPVVPDSNKYVEQPPPAAFPTAQAAAISFANTQLQVTEVARQSDCRANAACFWFVTVADGHDALVYGLFGGSNNDLLRCYIYVVHDNNWRPLNVRCGRGPAVGLAARVALPMGQTGCVKVHSTPGLTTKVLQCLKAGTSVLVDGGPYYLPTQASTGSNGPSAVDLWWHLAGRGWMVHEYLFAAS